MMMMWRFIYLEVWIRRVRGKVRDVLITTLHCKGHAVNLLSTYELLQNRLSTP